MANMLLSWTALTPPRLLLGAVILFTLVCCREPSEPLQEWAGKTIFSFQNGAAAKPLPPSREAGRSLLEKYTAYTTEAFVPGAAAITQSDVWAPTRCDVTSQLSDSVCRFYTAGRWTGAGPTPLWDRLTGGSLTCQAPQTTSCDADALAHAMRWSTCRKGGNHSLRLSLDYDPTGACVLPRSSEEVLQRLFMNWLQGQRCGGRSADASDLKRLPEEPMTLSFQGNSVLRGPLYGLIRMLRGLKDGFDRSVHSSFVYVATTKGDLLYLWDENTTFVKREFLWAAQQLVGGAPLLYVEFTFTGMSFPLVSQLMREAPPRSHDMSFLFFNYIPHESRTLDHHQRVRRVFTQLETLLEETREDQVVLLFEAGNTMNRFCWDHPSPQLFPAAASYNQLQKAFVKRYNRERMAASSSGGRTARVLLVPQREVIARCGVQVRDRIHTESILAPPFPALSNVVSGASWAEHYADVSHLLWYVIAMLL